MQKLSIVLCLLNVVLISFLFYVLKVLCGDGGIPLTSFTHCVLYVIPLIDVFCGCLLFWSVKKKKVELLGSLFNSVVSLMLVLFLSSVMTQIGQYLRFIRKVCT